MASAAPLLGCSPADPERNIGQIVFEDGPRPPSPEGSRSESLSDAQSYFGARTEDGGIVVASAASGSIIAEVSPLHEKLRPADLLFDAHRARLVAVDEDEEGSLSTLTAAPLSWTDAGQPALGAPTDLGYLDGIVRLSAMPSGLVGFEESYGTRWRLWAEGGPPTPSVPAPRPQSTWIADAGREPVSLSALVQTAEGALEFRRAEVDEAGVAMSSIEAISLGTESGAPPSSPRAAVWGSERVLAGVVDGRVAIWSAGLAPTPPFVVEVKTERIEHVSLLRDGRLILVLLSSPTRLLAIDRGAPGDPGGPTMPFSLALLEVPADVTSADQFFSRELLVLDDHRVLLATERGVVSIRLTEEAGSLALSVDPTFDAPALRGPLAGPIAGPHES